MSFDPHNIFRPLSRGWIVVASGAASAVVTMLLWRIEGELGGAGVADLKLSWTGTAMGNIIASWGDRGQELAKSTFWLQFIRPPAYALFFSSFAAYIAHRTQIPESGRMFSGAVVLACIPWAAALFGEAANAIIAMCIFSRRCGDVAAITASVITTAEGLLTGACVIILVAILVRTRKIRSGAR